MSDHSSDRTVHARLRPGVELVRYDKAGKWWVEDTALGRSSVTIDQAVRIANNWKKNGGRVYLAMPGGKQFDKGVSR